jgi:hypothetical protein
MRTLLILSLLSTFLTAQQYILSYRSVVQANQITYENFLVSRAMKPKKHLKNIASLRYKYEQGMLLTSLIYNYQDDIHAMMFKAGILLHDDTKNKNAMLKERTVLTMPPRYVDISVKGDFATITLLK